MPHDLNAALASDYRPLDAADAPPPAATPHAMDRPSSLRRLGGLLIDAAVYLGSIAAGAVLATAYSSATDAPSSGARLVALVLVPVVLATLAQTLATGFTGQSVGKHVLAMRVVRTGGERCGVGRAFIRDYALFVLVTTASAALGVVDASGVLGALVTFIVYVVDVAMVFGAQGRRLVDHLAGTRVIHVVPAEEA